MEKRKGTKDMLVEKCSSEALLSMSMSLLG
jgi:hypothetical protein